MKQDDMVYMQRINDLVIKKQKESGMKINQIADKIGIGAGSLSNYRGQQNKHDRQNPQVPNLLSAKKIAEYFDVSLDYLVGRTNIKTPQVNTAEVCKRYGLSENALGILELLMEHRETAIDYNGKKYRFGEVLYGLNWIFDTDEPAKFFAIISRFVKRYYDGIVVFHKEAESGGTPDNPAIENSEVFSAEEMEGMHLAMIQAYLLTERAKQEGSADNGNSD